MFPIPREALSPAPALCDLVVHDRSSRSVRLLVHGALVSPGPTAGAGGTPGTGNLDV